LSTPSTISSTISVSRPTQAVGSEIHSMIYPFGVNEPAR
jgi:hypothetical protein